MLVKQTKVVMSKITDEKETKNVFVGTDVYRGTLREQIGILDQEFKEMGQIGAMYYEQGNLEKARIIFEGLVEIDPESADAHAALGGLLTRTQQYDEALIHLNRAIELNAEQIAPYVNLAEIYIRQRRAGKQWLT